jgi:hypothetical protein
MDLSWIKDLTPVQIGELLLGLFAFIILAKHTGLSIDRKGFHFRSAEKTGAILETVTAIRKSDAKQEAKIDALSETVNNNVKDILRLTFYNTALTVPEQLVAGKRYLEAGGNGPTEKAIRELSWQHQEAWEAITMVSEKK